MDPVTIALLGSLGLGGLSAIFGGKGKEIEPKTQEYAIPWGRDVLASWLFSPFQFNQEANTWEMRGVPPYPGQTSPKTEDTMLPNVWNSWSPNNAASDYMNQMLKQGFDMSDDMKNVKSNMLQYGGPGGQLTDQMWKQAQWGGAGQKGQPAMDMIMQFGTPSKVGEYLSNMAQFGIPSEAGRIVADRAQGAPVGGAKWLAEYMKPAPFDASASWMPRR